MISIPDIESLGFWYNKRRKCFYRSQTEIGIVLQEDGTVIIDNVGSYGSYKELFKGQISKEVLRDKLVELGGLPK